MAWDGGCLFIGHHQTALPVHSHQAIQLVFGTGDVHLVRAGENEPWLPYSMAAIPSRQPHAIDVTGADTGAVILVEPETREGRAITNRLLRAGIADVGSDDSIGIGRQLFAARNAGRRDDVVRLARLLVQALSDGVEPPVTTDPRILRAIEYLNAHLSGTIALTDVASHVCLSPSRFRHLFAEQTGMGLRPYVLWRRFICAWELIAQGDTLTSAAHAAGFADSAHLSRTSTRTFGFAPSALQFVTVGLDQKRPPH